MLGWSSSAAATLSKERKIFELKAKAEILRADMAAVITAMGE